MKLTASKVYELRESYQDCRDGYIYYQNRVSNGGGNEDSQWLSFYDGQLYAMERVLRALDLEFDDLMSIVAPKD